MYRVLGKIPLPVEGVAGEARRGSVGRRSRSEFPFPWKGWIFCDSKKDGVVLGDTANDTSRESEELLADTTPALRATPSARRGILIEVVFLYPIGICCPFFWWGGDLMLVACDNVDNI